MQWGVLLCCAKEYTHTHKHTNKMNEKTTEPANHLTAVAAVTARTRKAGITAVAAAVRVLWTISGQTAQHQQLCCKRVATCLVHKTQSFGGSKTCGRFVEACVPISDCISVSPLVYRPNTRSPSQTFPT